MHEAAIDSLATALLADDGDITDIYEALQSLLPGPDFELLGAKLELCPTHLCDEQICRDDDTHAVYVVIGDTSGPHVEVLDARPQWDWKELGQVVYVANVNGGDSQEI